MRKRINTKNINGKASEVSSKNKKKKIFSSGLEEVKKVSEPLYKTPNSTQQLIEIKKISKSGIFEVAQDIYSKTYRFSDINYESEPDSEQILKFKKYAKLLDCIGTDFKITILNKKRDIEEFKKAVFYPYRDDGFDGLRDFFNNEIENSLNSANDGIEQIMYLTVTIRKKDFDEAKAFFVTLEGTLLKKFKELSSNLVPLSGNERLNLIRSIYQMDDKYAMPVTINDYIQNYGDFCNDICCTNFKYENANIFRINNKYCQAVYISRYSNSLTDRFIKHICSLGIYSIVSVDYVPIPREAGKKYVENKLFGVEHDIDKQQQKRNKDLAFSSEISRKKRNQKKDIEEILDDVEEKDENMYFVGTTVIVFADTKEELISKVDSLRRSISDEGCRADVYMWKMREALNTALPLGVRQVANTRFMVTRSAAALFPFTVQELQDRRPGTFFYGRNLVSQNSVFANRKYLFNGNGFVFGIPGFGKSVSIKLEMLSAFLNTDDDIIIIDPTLEYKSLVKICSGEYINLTNSTDTHINPLKVLPEELDLSDMNGNIGDMSEFMEGLCEKALGHSRDNYILDPITDAVITEAVRNLYFRQIKEELEEVTLTDFLDEVAKNSRPEAESLTYAMQKYTTGSLNIFNHKQNVNISNRITCFGIRDLGETMRPMAMMITLVAIKKKVMENFAKGKATWLYVDEFHEMLGTEYTENYFIKLIKEIRKLGGIVTCATQNVADTLQSDRIRSMVDNSEYVLMLKQAPGAIPELIDTISGMKVTYEDYLLMAEPGQGMMKFGNTIFPITMQLGSDSSLYNLFNTNFHENTGAI